MISKDQEKEIDKITEEFGEDKAEEIRNLSHDEYLKYSGYTEDELTYPEDNYDKYEYEDYLAMAFEIEKSLMNSGFSQMPREEALAKLTELKRDLAFDEAEEFKAKDHMRRTEIREDIKYDKMQIDLANLRLKQLDIMDKAEDVAKRHSGR